MQQKSLKLSLYNDRLDQNALINVIDATFVDQHRTTFEGLLQGYSSMRVLTYSNSLPIIGRAAALLDELEVIFGREDLLGEMKQYMSYQEHLIHDLIKARQEHDVLRIGIEEGRIRFYVLREIVSHAKVYLLEGTNGNCVITGSANFSERAFSGRQVEDVITFKNNGRAWSYYNEQYDRIKASATMEIPLRAVLADECNIENLPAIAAALEATDGTSIRVEDRPPRPTPLTKVFTHQIPKAYNGLDSLVATDRDNMKQLNRSRALKIVRYVRSNRRSREHNPEEWLTIDRAIGRVVLSGREVDLKPSGAEIENDVRIFLEFYNGYTQFRGDAKKLMRDYFTFMSWFFVSPFLCDFRNQALSEAGYLHDYPRFGILYGKSNCGKSELLRMLLRSMFDYEGFLRNEWFTKTMVNSLQQENRRFPLVFDDLDRSRYNRHATDLIKDDHLSLSEYPAIILSMNAGDDTFSTEIRKRCLIIYTGASLPDHTGESRELARQLQQLKHNLGTGLYRAYLRRVLKALREEMPQDLLSFSSRHLIEIFRQHLSEPLPRWCRPVSMADYSEAKHDKVKNELLQLWKYERKAWQLERHQVILTLDWATVRKLTKDIPDYLIVSAKGNILILDRDELEDFMGVSMRRGLAQFFTPLAVR